MEKKKLGSKKLTFGKTYDIKINEEAVPLNVLGGKMGA